MNKNCKIDINKKNKKQQGEYNYEKCKHYSIILLL